MAAKIITFESVNVSPRPMRVYANEGIAQVLFLEGEPPAVTYNDRQGKYQGQGAEVVLPRV
jgi:dCTP deaminase